MKKAVTNNFTSFYKGPYTVVKIKKNLNFHDCYDGMKKNVEVLYNMLKKYKTREQFLLRMQNGTRPQLQETTSSAEITDEKFIEIEVEGTVLPGCANQNAAAEETDNEYYTPQNKKNKIPKFGTSKKSSRAIIPAVGKEDNKSFTKSSAGAQQLFLELNRHKSVPPLRGKSTGVRSVSELFAHNFVYIDDDDNSDNDYVFASGSKWVVTMDKEADLSNLNIPS